MRINAPAYLHLSSGAPFDADLLFRHETSGTDKFKVPTTFRVRVNQGLFALPSEEILDVCDCLASRGPRRA